MTDRTPPHDDLAEQCVLGGMLLAKSAITDVGDILTAADFYDHRHAWLFELITAADDRGDPTDVVSVNGYVTDAGQVGKLRDHTYLHTLISSVPTAANTVHYAKRVASLASLRRLIEVGTRIVQIGYGTDGGAETDVEDAIDRAQAELHAATTTRKDGELILFGDLLDQILDGIEENGKRGDGILGLSTGLVDVDALTGGYRPGQLVVVAGRPGMGKSVHVVDLCRHTAFRAGKPVLFFSLEMSVKEIGERIVAAETGIDLHDIQRGNLTDRQWTDVARMSGKVAACPLHVSDSASMTLASIRARARRAQQRHGVELVVIDYLQLLTTASRRDSREREVAEMSRGLKLLAKELGCPVVAAAQLNRGPEQRPNKVPTMADLRESGAVENDSDVVILLHRPDYYDKKSPRVGEADFILAKNRHGATDTVTVAAQLHYSRFMDFTPDPAPGSAASFRKAS